MLFPTNENIFTAPKINELKYKPSSIASSMLCDPVATISWYRCADSSKSWTNSAHVFSYSHRPIVDSYKEWKKTQEKKKCSFFFWSDSTLRPNTNKKRRDFFYSNTLKSITVSHLVKFI